MCTGVIVHLKDGSRTECETQGELAHVLGGKGNLVYLPGEHVFEPVTCLCPVDTKTTAEENGFEFYPVCFYVENGQVDSFNEHYFER